MYQIEFSVSKGYFLHENGIRLLINTDSTGISFKSALSESYWKKGRTWGNHQSFLVLHCTENF